MTHKFELGRDLYIAPTHQVSLSYVIVLTNKETSGRCRKYPPSLHCATLVEKNSPSKTTTDGRKKREKIYLLKALW